MSKESCKSPQVDMEYFAIRKMRINPDCIVECMGLSIIGRAYMDLKNPSYRPNALIFFTSKGVEEIIDNFSISKPASYFRKKVNKYLEGLKCQTVEH